MTRAERLATLAQHYKPAGIITMDNADNRFLLVVQAGARDRGGEIVFSTHPTFETACDDAVDSLLSGYAPNDGIFDLDTGEMIELHFSSPVVTRSEEQGIMINPLNPE